MKLDTSHMRYLTADDFKVLQAMEIGSRNHELVPIEMIHSIGSLKSPSATNRSLGDLAKLKLVARLRNAKYDGFRITYLGYDYLALKLMLKRDSIYSVGTKIGVGKESDIYVVSDKNGAQKVLKIHRLGRTSFKTVKNNRDYLKNKQTSNWMYLSRLAAEKEFQFMRVLYDLGFNVPIPYDNLRHCVLMELIKGYCMKHMKKYPSYKKLYSDLMNFIVKLANHGLIHCDYNEFNIMIRDEEDAKNHEYGFVVIDFPQCVSIEHTDAKFYFDRDVQGIRDFFAKKFLYEPEHDPTMLDTDGYGEGYKYAYPNFKRDVLRMHQLDAAVSASGYVKKKSREDRDLESAVVNMRALELGSSDDDASEFDSDVDYDDSEDGYDSDEYEEEDLDDDNLAEDEAAENEKIISALSSGSQNLKMDKLGNYIIEE
ncbi:hypothetical protein PUMCH_004977 [Australozyma saopauloensis]|uniref:Serine/threonine-protein kinase RIO2 n=1 Tax=Australozyma saopauloensis TaxID=291208 RepID=A0AAX4HG35_9ASCO|nr:hypothetical protein PUMCH_004977 [[Candida] saopauloensis]